MELRQMIYFKTIVEQGTISKAAKVLHLAQPPLSIQLKQLEAELEVTLVKRGNRQIELTPAGELFYKRCLQILALSEIASEEVKQSNQEYLRIGLTSSNHSVLAKEPVATFIKRHPHLNYTIREGSTYEILDLLLAHNIDLGIVRTPFDSSLVKAIYVKKEPLVAVGKAEFFAQKKEYLQDLENTPLIIHQRYLTFIQDYCLNQQINIKLKMKCDDSRTSLFWARLGYGVALIPNNQLLTADSNLLMMPLKDRELYTGMAFITRKNETISPTLQQFITKLCQ